MIDPLTGEFPVTPRESRKAKRARVRATEASKRGRRSIRKGRHGDLKTLKYFEGIVPDHLIEDRRRKEAGNISTGLDQVIHHPAMRLAIQTKEEVRPSIRAAWLQALSGMPSVTSEYWPMLRVEWSGSRNPHMELAVIRPRHLTALRIERPYIAVWEGKNCRVRERWVDVVANAPHGMTPVLSVQYHNIEPLCLLDWSPFLTRYREAVTR